MLPIYSEIDAYLKTKEHLWQANPLKNSRSTLKTCILFSSELEPRELFEELTKANYGRYTIKTYFLIASGFEKHWKQTDHIKEFMRKNAFAFRNAYQEKTTRMTEAAFKKIVEGAPNAGTHNLLILLGQCGLRKAEALKAKWTDFNKETGVLSVLGKGRKLRRVPLNREWIRPIENSEFITGQRGLGLVPFIYRTGFTFIDFRSYFATRVANHPELSIRDAQMLLGHSSVLTTQKYVRVDQDRVHKTLMKG